MKVGNKTIIAVGVLCVGAAVALMVDNKGGSSSDARIGKRVFESTDLIKAAKITIASTNDRVELSRQESGSWELTSAASFPVDVNRVKTLFDNLENLKFQRVASRKGKNLAKFGLEKPTSLTLHAQGKDTTLKLGENRSGGGQYISLGDEKKVYLIDRTISASTESSSWEYKTMVNIEPDLVKSVSFHVEGHKSAVEVSREKKEEDLKLVTAFKKEKVKEYQVKGMTSVLQGLSFSKRHDNSNELAKTALAKAHQATVTLFDGRRYQLDVGFVGKDAKDRKYFAAVTKIADGKDVTKEQKQQDALMQRVMGLAKYEVSAHVYAKVFKKAEDFFEKKISQKNKGNKKG